MNRLLERCSVVVALLMVVSCGEASEAPRVKLPVVVDSSGLVPVITNLGYNVEVTSARMLLKNISFAVAGETSATSRWQDFVAALIPVAHAHSGHYDRGEIAGEMLGEFVVQWPQDEGRELGFATLIATKYGASNFGFSRGYPGLLSADDPLVNHTAIVEGVATKNGNAITFMFVVDADDGQELIGALFEESITENSSGQIRLSLNTVGFLDESTLFDSIDFELLEANNSGVVRLGPEMSGFEEPYNTFRDNLLTHLFYSAKYQD